ncbi:FUSC family protein [Streptomyces tropicalis]|uniref:FUSC family protein n=1 Tax=Streptomyces tropicalis TaxID=3034234 RepID=A0ABT6A6I3_9ACTN|nr:FUSC family protein [Streptomyces tropicalis]MDF3300256.1 FUSC family protein [Streptomyces tropicalis]
MPGSRWNDPPAGVRRRGPAGARGVRRAPVAAVGRALSPRGALALREVDGAFLFAARAAVGMGVAAVPIVAAGRPDLAVYAMLGSFTSTFGRDLPYARRARVLALAAVAMTACVGGGSALALATRPGGTTAGAAWVVAATAVVAGVAKFVCDAARLEGLGAVLLLFSFAVAANAPAGRADVGTCTALAAAGAALAWPLGVSGRLVHPDRPQRLAVANAQRAVAELLEASGAGDVPRRTRHGATVAVLHAYRCLGRPPPARPRTPAPGRDAVFVRLTDRSWTLLVRSAQDAVDDPAGMARHLRGQARLLTGRRHRLPSGLYEAPPGTAPPGAAGGTARTAAAGATETDAAALRAGELLVGRPGHGVHLGVLAVPALRMALGTGAAGGLAALLHLEHGYWAAVTAAAVLHSVNLRTTAQRAVQRTLGTATGLLIALVLLAAHPEPLALALVIVCLEFLLEYLVARNYALGVVFLTPMALLLSDLAAPAPTGELVLDRVLGSVLGIAVGLLCALLVVHDRAATRVDRALAACAALADEAERTRSGTSSAPLALVQVRLATAVVELREADDAAAGELWPAGIDPAGLAATERRAYTLLAELDRRR